MKFFAMIDGERRGPFPLEELADHGVTPDTYIWCKGMDDWELARDNADVCRYFRRRLLDLMHPGTAPTPDETVSADTQEVTDEDPLDSIPLRYRGQVRRSGETPGPPLSNEPDLSRQPPSLILPAVLAALLCSPLIGIVAIIFASKASSAWKAGNPSMAWDYTRKAKMWIGLTIFLGIILNILLMKFLELAT